LLCDCRVECFAISGCYGFVRAALFAPARFCLACAVHELLHKFGV
jgi:hypothetical protein